jgi:uncharacterized protein with HEPN domain
MWAAFFADLVSKLATSLVAGVTSWVKQQELEQKASKAAALERQMASIGEAAKREQAIIDYMAGQKAKPPISIEEWNKRAT